MPNVYVINDSGHDYSGAGKFGKLVVISRGRVNKLHLTEMYRDFYDFLKDSTKRDFIVQSGPTIMCMVAVAMFAAMHGRINLLIWSELRQSYVVRRLKFPEGVDNG